MKTQHKLQLSIIIPMYNEEKYIGQCLESIIKHGQGFVHQIIVVDNQSSDKSTTIVQQFPGVNLLSETIKGPTFARQLGYQHVTGNILAFLDADTRPTKQRFIKVLKQFGENDQLGFLSGPYSFYDMSLFRQFISRFNRTFIVYPSSLFVGYFGVGGNMIIRKTVLDQMHGFDTGILFHGDDTDAARRAHQFAQSKFMLSLKMQTSARRYLHQGFFTTSYLYTMAFIHTLFFHQPNTQQYKDFR